MVWFKCHINIYAVCAISAVTFSNTGLANRLSLAHHSKSPSCSTIGPSMDLLKSQCIMFSHETNCTICTIMSSGTWYIPLVYDTYYFVTSIFKEALTFSPSQPSTCCWPFARNPHALAEDALVFFLLECHAWKHFRSCISHLNTSNSITTQNHITTPTNLKACNKKAGWDELINRRKKKHTSLHKTCTFFFKLMPSLTHKEIRIKHTNKHYIQSSSICAQRI